MRDSPERVCVTSAAVAGAGKAAIAHAAVSRIEPKCAESQVPLDVSVGAEG